MSLARLNRSNVSPVALLVATIVALNACGGDPEGMPSAEFPAAPDLAAMRQDRPFNVLIVTLDTTRADHIGAYGAGAAETPVIDALAGSGVMFERAYSPVPLTLPAHTSLFTGTYPFDHGVRDNGSFIVPAELTTAAEAFRERGFQTAALVSAFVLDSRWGLDQGFDTYIDDFGAGAEQAILFSDVQKRADQIVDDALAWMDSKPDGPFFLWVHLYDPHAPYDPPEPYARRFANDPYAGEIAFMDAQIGRLLDRLDETGERDRSFVVVAGDHGESLGEHGENEHGFFIYEAATRVPLIFSTPFEGLQGITRSEVVSLVDVLPTLLEMNGIEAPAGIQGRSLTPLFSETPPVVGTIAYAETLYPRFHYGWSELTSVQDNRLKLIMSSDPELYDLVDDPGETVNLAADRPDDVDRLTGIAESLLAAAGAPGAQTIEIDAATRRALESLGYLSGGSATIAEPDGPRPSPRDRIAVFNKSLRARGLLRNGNLVGAERLYAEIAAENPEVPIAFERLGEIYSALGRLDEAVEALRNVVPLKPDWAYSYTNLAEAQLALGHVEAAEQTLLDSFDLAEPVSHTFCLLGYFNEIRADLRGAIDDYEACLDLDPRSAGALAHLAMLRLQLNEMDAAEAHAREAIAIDPTEANVNLVLARLHMMRDEPEQALRYYQDELRGNPDNLLAHFDLAMVQGQEGRVAEEELHLARVLEIDPTHSRAALALARLYIENNKNYQRGVDVLSAAVEQPMSTEDLAASYDILADLHQRLGNSALAREFRQRARDLRSP